VLHHYARIVVQMAAPRQRARHGLVRRCVSLSGGGAYIIQAGATPVICSRLGSGCPPTVAVVELAPFLVDPRRDGF
jgi:hypothetical protein